VRLLVLATLLLSSHCAPQVVDAVDPEGEGGGDGARAGSGTGGGVVLGGMGGGAGTGCSGDGCVGPNPDRDRDGDGTPDLDDGCPDRPDKIEPGVCGCQIPDADRPDYAGCLGLMQALLHRYSFDGEGDVARDTAGLVPGAAVDPTVAPANGIVINTALMGTGRLSLAGGMNGRDDDDQYLNLPSGLISGLQSVTIEAFITWYGGREWQRIFDFGSNDSGVLGAQGPSGTSYLFLTPSDRPDGAGHVQATYKQAGLREVLVDSTRPLPTGLETQVAVVLDTANDTLALYLDGSLESTVSGMASSGAAMRLELIDDANSWLGRSQFVADAELGASLDELRIYAAALSAAQLRTSKAAGPNPVFFPNH
jgi:hypothetical protein